LKFISKQNLNAFLQEQIYETIIGRKEGVRILSYLWAWGGGYIFDWYSSEKMI